MRHSFLRALAIAAALIAGAPALAQSDVRSMSVSYADLDISHAAGRAALERRIAGAAKTVCGFENSRELALMLAQRRCVTETIDRTQDVLMAAVEQRSTVRVARASAGRPIVAR